MKKTTKVGLILLLSCALCLAGCRTRLVKPGAQPGDFDQDLAECDYKTSLALASYGGSGGGYNMASAAGSGFADGVDIAFRTRDLNLKCMKLKGWVEG